MKVLFHADEIAKRVESLGQEITVAYKNRDLIVVGVLKGGFMFVSDLVRHIDLPLKLDFTRISSYAGAQSPTTQAQILMDVETDISAKDVLIVDDILDTGQSMLAFREHLMRKAPASVKICTMLDKTSRRAVPISPDFFGFRIEGGFVVGYGLDHAEYYRSLPDIYILNPENGR